MAQDEYHEYVRDPDGLLDQLSTWDDIDINEVLARSEERQKERLTQELERIERQLEGREHSYSVKPMSNLSQRSRMGKSAT